MQKQLRTLDYLYKDLVLDIDLGTVSSLAGYGVLMIKDSNDHVLDNIVTKWNEKKNWKQLVWDAPLLNIISITKIHT